MLAIENIFYLQKVLQQKRIQVKIEVKPLSLPRNVSVVKMLLYLIQDSYYWICWSQCCYINLVCRINFRKETLLSCIKFIFNIDHINFNLSTRVSCCTLLSLLQRQLLSNQLLSNLLPVFIGTSRFQFCFWLSLSGVFIIKS